MKSLITVKFSILFALLFAASISFTACSDVAGPNNDDSSIVMTEDVQDLQDLRRRGARTTAAGEGTEKVLSCSFGTKDLRFGGQQEKVGTINIQIVNDNKLVIDFKADAGWEFSETVVGINIVRPNGSTQPFGQWNPGSEDYDPKVTAVTREVVITGSPHNISPGDTFSVGAKAQAHSAESNGSGQTSTAGDLDMSQGQAKYFKITWECPAPTDVSFNGAG